MATGVEDCRRADQDVSRQRQYIQDLPVDGAGAGAGAGCWDSEVGSPFRRAIARRFFLSLLLYGFIQH
jgi:hypothetical protein